MSIYAQRPLTHYDAVGEEFADIYAAKRAAVERIRTLLNQEAGWAAPNMDRYVEISDQCGDVLATITFREAAGLDRGQ